MKKKVLRDIDWENIGNICPLLIGHWCLQLNVVQTSRCRWSYNLVRLSFNMWQIIFQVYCTYYIIIVIIITFISQKNGVCIYCRDPVLETFRAITRRFYYWQRSWCKKNWKGIACHNYQARFNVHVKKWRSIM